MPTVGLRNHSQWIPQRRNKGHKMGLEHCYHIFKNKNTSLVLITRLSLHNTALWSDFNQLKFSYSLHNVYTGWQVQYKVTLTKLYHLLDVYSVFLQCRFFTKKTELFQKHPIIDIVVHEGHEIKFWIRFSSPMNAWHNIGSV